MTYPPLNYIIISNEVKRKLDFRQYRTKIVCVLRRQIFRQIAENDAGILVYVKEFLAKMTENMQARRTQSRQAVIVRCCL